jgi:hypothetical protein
MKEAGTAHWIAPNEGPLIAADLLLFRVVCRYGLLQVVDWTSAI